LPPDKRALSREIACANGTARAAQFCRGVDLVNKILRAMKPGDIAVELSDTFELAVNLNTARSDDFGVFPVPRPWAIG